MAKKTKKKGKTKRRKAVSRRAASLEAAQPGGISGPKSRKELLVWMIAVVICLLVGIFAFSWGGMRALLLPLTIAAVILKELIAYRQNKTGYKGMNGLWAGLAVIVIVILIGLQWYAAKKEGEAKPEGNTIAREQAYHVP